MLERLDEGAQQQQQFLDDAGHELRTPLTILRGHLELETVDDPEDVIATRDVLLDEVDRMQRLVDDLLLLANSGDPGFIRREPVRIPELLDQVMEKVHVLADRQWQIDEKADYVVDADPQRLTQALVQLAANAVKYTGPSSTIALGSRIEGPTAADGTPLPGVGHPPAVGARRRRSASRPRTSNGSSNGSAGRTRAAARKARDWAWQSSRQSPRRTAAWPPWNPNTATGPRS